MHNFTKMKYVNNREDLLREASENIKIKKKKISSFTPPKKGKLGTNLHVLDNGSHILDSIMWQHLPQFKCA